MKRPSAKTSASGTSAKAAKIKKPAAALPKKKPKAAPKKPPKKEKKEVQLTVQQVAKETSESVSLRILYIGGGELLQLNCPATWSTLDVRAAVNQELSRVQAAGRLEKLVHVGGGVIPDGKILAEAGLQHGTEIYAVLYQPLSSEDEEEEDELYDGYSDYELADDLYDLDHTRPAAGEWDECIRGCGNRGSNYYGGECRNCYDEH